MRVLFIHVTVLAPAAARRAGIGWVTVMVTQKKSLFNRDRGDGFV